jgi:hypothetical protein
MECNLVSTQKLFMITTETPSDSDDRLPAFGGEIFKLGGFEIFQVLM